MGKPVYDPTKPIRRSRMRLAAKYSHLNGEEYLLVHHRELWEDVQTVIREVDASRCRTKLSFEKTRDGAGSSTLRST